MTEPTQLESLTDLYLNLLNQRENLDVRIEAARTTMLQALAGRVEFEPGQEIDTDSGPYHYHVRQGIRRKVNEEALNDVVHGEQSAHVMATGAIRPGKHTIDWRKVEGLPKPMRDAMMGLAEVSKGPLSVHVTKLPT